MGELLSDEKKVLLGQKFWDLPTQAVMLYVMEICLLERPVWSKEECQVNLLVTLHVLVIRTQTQAVMVHVMVTCTQRFGYSQYHRRQRLRHSEYHRKKI